MPDPLVSILMGSDSDWPTMSAAADALAEFGVEFEADVVSAHRMPEDMVRYGREAHQRGIKVIIAGAGGAAHLPGMLASLTPLPVIGVPVPLIPNTPGELPFPLWPLTSSSVAREPRLAFSAGVSRSFKLSGT